MGYRYKTFLIEKSEYHLPVAVDGKSSSLKKDKDNILEHI